MTSISHEHRGCGHVQNTTTKFLELIYDNQSMFSLCDEDLGLCDCLKHMIPTTMDKPVYLPHHTIPVQLQAEVRKCLRHLAETGHHKTFKKPLHITSHNSQKEDQRDSLVCGFLCSKCHDDLGFISFT